MLTRRSTLIVPSPKPLPPDTMLIQGWSGTAVQLQPAPAVIVMFCAGAPDASNVNDPGEAL